jgi:UDP-glucose 4-epimerase
MIVVTGSAGYIGGQTVLELANAGYSVFGIDKELHSNQIKEYLTDSIQADFSSNESLHAIAQVDPIAIIHCAGTSLVGPSVKNPEEYFDNNFVKTKILIDSLISNKMTDCRFIFSSSASVYGDPVMNPILETDPTLAFNPYGQSKLAVEYLLNSYNTAYATNCVSLRYFNACGSDPLARHGQKKNATHIIPKLITSNINNESFSLFGTSFPTPDGTAIRDYVHVSDIAQAHVMSINGTVAPGVYNLANSRGYSNKEIIDLVQEQLTTELVVIETQMREGDPPQLTADSSKFQQISNWAPKYSIQEMITHAIAWHTKDM